MTKDGGMVAQSFVVDCCIAKAEVRIAARIRPVNSKVRWDCGQPANPRSNPVATAIAAKATTPERGIVLIQLPSTQSSTSRSTTGSGAMPGPALGLRHNWLRESVLEDFGRPRDCGRVSRFDTRSP